MPESRRMNRAAFLCALAVTALGGGAASADQPQGQEVGNGTGGLCVINGVDCNGPKRPVTNSPKGDASGPARDDSRSDSR